MANVRAFRSGNWSDTSVATSPWSNGTTVFAPSSADDVWAAGFTVTIDQAVTVLSLRNNGSASQAWKDGGTAAAANGGGFSMPVAYNITATNSIQCGSAICLTYSASGSATLTSASIPSSSANNIHCITITGSGTLTISSANLYGAGGGSTVWVVNVISGGVVLTNCTISTSTTNFSGCVLVGVSGTLTANNCTISGGTYLANGLQNNGVSILNSCTINAQVSVSSTSVINNPTGTLNINNSTITGIGALSNAGGTVNALNCTFTASAFGTPFASSSGTNIVSGYFYDSSSGFPAIYLYKWRMGVSPTNGIWRIALNGSSTYVNLYTSDNSTALNQAVPTDVRSGVVYGIGGTQTGRLTVPARGSVSLNVNYGPSMPFTAIVSGTTATATLAYSYPLVVGDQIIVTGSSNAEWNSTYTIASVVSGTSVTFVVPATHSATAGTGALMQTRGTAVLDPAAVATAVWGAATRTLTTSSGPTAAENASAVWAAASRTLTADIGPTAATIASAVWAAADKTGYSLTSAERTAIATAVESSILNEGDGQAVLNAIVGAIGNSNVDQVALVAAIRSDLERAGGRLVNLDATISSRLAASSYTAPTSAPTAANVATAVWGAATKVITGGVVDTLTNAPSVPSAASIRVEIDSNSTQLAAIKTKTDNLPASPAATGDIPSANISAIKAKTDLLNTDRLAQVSTVSTTGAQLAAALS